MAGQADNASEKAYALGGMQAICKHNGVFKRTILPRQIETFWG